MAACPFLPCWVLVLVTMASPVGAVTPLAKVTTLLTDLKAEVEKTQTDSETTYQKFAVFCEEKTTAKSTEITETSNAIDANAAGIKALAAEISAEEQLLAEDTAARDAKTTELEAKTKECLEDDRKYQVADADTRKAIKSVADAITSLQDSKPSFLQMTSKQVLEALQAAGVDPNDPEYKFHSDGLIQTLENLSKEFTSKKKLADAEYTKIQGLCEQSKTNLGTEIFTAKEGITDHTRTIGTKKSDKATDTQTLSDQKNKLVDAKKYMEDLTDRCETVAKQHDEKHANMAGELEALEEAIRVIGGTTELRGSGSHDADRAQFADYSSEATNFVQLNAVGGVRLHQRSKEIQTSSAQEKQARAMASLVKDSEILRSSVLSELLLRAANNPFEKVKKLIQQLIERLVMEATSENSKQGWCDTEVAKAKKERDYRHKDVQKLSKLIRNLDVDLDQLKLDIGILSGDEDTSGSVKEVIADIKEDTENRASEKTDNLKTIKDGKEGTDAIQEAVDILNKFYGNFKVGLLQKPEWSEVDDDEKAAGINSREIPDTYHGKQDSATGIIALLKVIKTDFEITVNKATDAEKTNQKAFVKSNRQQLAAQKSRETELENKSQLSETKTTKRNQAVKDMESNQELLDAALLTLQELHPVCVDTGMTYDQRLAKRDKEIAALKTALCQLDGDGVEQECD